MTAAFREDDANPGSWLSRESKISRKLETRYPSFRPILKRDSSVLAHSVEYNEYLAALVCNVICAILVRCQKSVAKTKDRT